MVPLYWDSHILETTLLPLGQKPRKHQTTPFWSCLVVLRTLPILSIGTFHRYRQLAEGLVHWDSLVSSFQVFLFGRYCQKYLKKAWFLAIFVIFFAIFVVLDATQIVQQYVLLMWAVSNPVYMVIISMIILIARTLTGHMTLFCNLIDDSSYIVPRN